MHINVKNPIGRDPFQQSDRDPIGRNAGKGDRNRSDPKAVANRFPKRGMGRPIPGLANRGYGRFRKTY